MAGGPRLTAGAGRRMLVLLVAVVLAHVLALQWVAHQMQQAPTLRPLGTPMFTRLLQPSTVVVAPAAPQKPAPRAKSPPRRNSRSS